MDAVGSHAATETPEESAPLTEEEASVLEALKSHIGPAGQKALPHESLVRFVRGYAFEKKAGGVAKWTAVACGEADKTIAWRKEVDADTLLTRPLDHWDEFAKSWSTGIYGTDNRGHPLLIERTQEFHLDPLLAMSVETLTLCQARNLELLQYVKTRISERLGLLVYKHCYILDVGGIGTAYYKVKDSIKAVFHVAQYYYPETLYKMFVINSPMLFRALWAVASPMIHPITKEKIKILGGKSQYLPELARNGISADQIPPSIGGTYTAGPRQYVPHAAPPAAAQ